MQGRTLTKCQPSSQSILARLLKLTEASKRLPVQDFFFLVNVVRPELTRYDLKAKMM